MASRRVGLVGFGSVAEHSHLPAWLSLKGIDVVAVADVSPARLERAGALIPGVKLYESPESLIDQADVDVIDICSPPALHAALLQAACRRKVPYIVCEKPMVLTEDEYVQVEQARRVSGSRVVSVNNWVHSDLNRYVVETLQDGAIGAVESISLNIGRPDCALGDAGWNPRWRTDIAYAGGGIILDHGWHQVYLLMGWMKDSPVAVRATTRTADPRHAPVEDEAHVDLLFPAGVGAIDLTWTARGRTNGGIVQGDRGVIHLFDDRIVVHNEYGSYERSFTDKLSVSSYHPEWFASVFHYNVFDSNGAAERNFAEAGTLIRVIRAAYRSAELGGQVCPLTPDIALSPLSKETATHVHSRGGGETH